MSYHAGSHVFRQTDRHKDKYTQGRSETNATKKLCLRFNNYHRNGESLAVKVAIKKITFKKPHPSYTRHIMCRQGMEADHFHPGTNFFNKAHKYFKVMLSVKYSWSLLLSQISITTSDPSVELTSMKLLLCCMRQGM